jgi:DNA-binding response OmpR family regulator
MKILLLEDDKNISESLKEFLELEGYQIDIAHNGYEVFDLTYEKNYDLYIFDVNVPHINGFDVLAELKQSGDTTPAIYITALIDIESLSRGFRLGAEDYIKKPFDPEELLIRIKNKYGLKNNMLYVDNFIYNKITRKLVRDNKHIILGEVQGNIFHTLMINQNEVVEIYLLINFLEKPTMNALRVNITKLKNKLGINIQNIRGRGYMIEKI